MMSSGGLLPSSCSWQVFWPPQQSKARAARLGKPLHDGGAKPPILGAARCPNSISIITSYFRGMTIIRTSDRTLALKCKQAHANGQEITIHYETPGGWNHATGIIQSVQRQRYRARPFSPFWEINLVKPELENAIVSRARVASGQHFFGK